MPAVIVENDTSQWEDETGAVYHFPKRYEKFLVTGTEVIYYKGRIKDKVFSPHRLSDAPHYFGSARIGKIYPDAKSGKGDLFAIIENFARFDKAISTKYGDSYLETIPESRVNNYWRDGVRVVSQLDYDHIISYSSLRTVSVVANESSIDDSLFRLTSANEGSEISYFGTRYERCRELRLQAIAIHGVECKVCSFNFEKAYGAYAKGFIHVHHIVPVSELGGEKVVNPETDLVPLCANCHAVVHRRRDRTLSVEELRSMFMSGGEAVDDF